MVLFNFPKNTNGNYFQKFIISLLQIGCASLIYMIPFYKIQPILLCMDKDSIFDISENFSCGKNDICFDRLVRIDYQHSYFSFQTSYYKSISRGEPLFKVQCQDQSSSLLINYYICIHFFGIILAEILDMKDHDGNYVIICGCIGFLGFNGLLAHLYFYGIDYDLRMFFILFFSGFLLRIYSRMGFTALIPKDKRKKTHTKSQIESGTILQEVNLLFCVSGIVNLGLYYFSMHFIWNFFFFSVASLIFLIMFFQKFNYSDRPEKIRFIDDSLSHEVSIDVYVPRPPQLFVYGKIARSFKWLYYFTFVVNSISYSLFKNYIDFYSYVPYENSTTGISFLFLNGVAILICEIICLLFSVPILKKIKHLIFFSPLLIAILISSVEITTTIHWNPVASVIIFSLSMFFILLLQKFIILSFDSNLLSRYQNQTTYKYLSRLSVLLSSLMVNNIQYCFIIISMVYFMIFLLIFRLNND